jgi:outer membrane murein-binding lipoprotein Lpp
VVKLPRTSAALSYIQMEKLEAMTCGLKPGVLLFALMASVLLSACVSQSTYDQLQAQYQQLQQQNAALSKQVAADKRRSVGSQERSSTLSTATCYSHPAAGR